MEVILIGNYILDQQESMLRFANVLHQELLKNKISCTLMQPPVLLGALCNSKSRLFKWIGYIDKFIVFPWILAWVLWEKPKPYIVHICDHSSAMYIHLLEAARHLITCNDLIAIKSALGLNPLNKTSITGKLLQNWILSGLIRAEFCACISEKTQSDLIEFSQRTPATTCIVYMGLNHPYRQIAPIEARNQLATLFDNNALPHSQPFILHVGNNSWYKNRLGLLYIYEALIERQSTQAHLIMVGPAPTESLIYFLDKKPWKSRVHFIEKVDNETLNALYSAAELFVFPSYEEGFGWPVLEAMAAGCPAITSNCAPMSEIALSAATYLPLPPHDNSRLKNWATVCAPIIEQQLMLPEDMRKLKIINGLARSDMFKTEAMIHKYLRIYDKIGAVNSKII